MVSRTTRRTRAPSRRFRHGTADAAVCLLKTRVIGGLCGMRQYVLLPCRTTLNDDVPQLRQFVEAGAGQEVTAAPRADRP
jgi:hypothetical protein